jgi:hypothetical protein
VLWRISTIATVYNSKEKGEKWGRGLATEMPERERERDYVIGRD